MAKSAVFQYPRQFAAIFKFLLPLREKINSFIEAFNSHYTRRSKKTTYYSGSDEEMFDDILRLISSSWIIMADATFSSSVHGVLRELVEAQNNIVIAKILFDDISRCVSGYATVKVELETVEIYCNSLIAEVRRISGRKRARGNRAGRRVQARRARVHAIAERSSVN